MAQFSFNASSAPQPSAPQRGPLPPGSYEVIIAQSDIKATKAGTGEYIELEMQIVDGEYTGRRIWERLNVTNPNKQAEDIARRVLTENAWNDIVPNDVLFFHNTSVNPRWAYERVATIGNHIFYSKTSVKKP